MNRIILFMLCFLMFSATKAQYDTLVLRFGEEHGITTSVSSGDSTAQNTVSENGFLPNLNAASRFLAQAQLGHNKSDIEQVAQQGVEDWIDEQLNTPRAFTMQDKVLEYVQYHRDSLGFDNYFTRQWRYAFWQYLRSSPDHLRQRMAFALSEILVISENSDFDNRPLAFAYYYDLLLDHAFGNYEDLLKAVTFSPAMGSYLTFVNNSKTVIAENKFPDENYAREIMQLFTIGLFELNMDGTPVLVNNELVPTYDNYTIAEFAKVFTGLSWADRDNFGKSARHDTTWRMPLKMFEDFHEPGIKILLNGDTIPNRAPQDYLLDIEDAVHNVFMHQNTPPFICRQLIQRLVTSNPSPQYIERVAKVFANDGTGTRGNLQAVVKAILLDPEAYSCSSGDHPYFGMLREPFIRYIHLNKAFSDQTVSGRYRNDMRRVQDYVEQRVLNAPTVFNFFTPNYQPLGPVTDAGLYGPEFQITDTKNIAGYVEALWRWLFWDDLADEYSLFDMENSAGYQDEVTELDLAYEMTLANDPYLRELFDHLNLVLAQGRLSQQTINLLVPMIKEFPQEDEQDLEYRVKVAIYMVMMSPEYLISR